MSEPRSTESLRAPEVASLLGIPLGSLYRAVAAGEIPVVRVGRRLRFFADQLEAWRASGGTK